MWLESSGTSFRRTFCTRDEFSVRCEVEPKTPAVDNERFIHLQRRRGVLGWRQEFKQQFDHILLFGLDYISAVDNLHVLENKTDQDAWQQPLFVQYEDARDASFGLNFRTLFGLCWVIIA